jgi:MFS family permease
VDHIGEITAPCDLQHQKGGAVGVVRAISLTPKSATQLFLLTTAMAAAGYSRATVIPLQEVMRVSLVLTDNQMAVLQGPTIGIPMLLVAFPLGLLIDRTRRSVLLRILMGLTFLGSIATAFAATFPLLLLARTLTGIAALSVLPVVMSLLADQFSVRTLGRATTVVIVGQVIGNALAFALGGKLVVVGGSWAWAMFWLSVGLLPVALLMLCLREPSRVKLEGRQTMSWVGIWGTLQRLGVSALLLSIGIVLAELAIGALVIWAIPMLSRQYSLQPDRAGALMAAGMLASGILGPVAGGTLADCGQRGGGAFRCAMLLAGLSCLCIPLACFAFVQSPTYAGAMLTASLMVMLAIAVMGMTLFTAVIPTEVRGFFVSFLVAGQVLFALAIGPPAVSLLAGVLGGLQTIGMSLSIVCIGAASSAACAFIFCARGLRFTACVAAVEGT